jgi:hypothetical protein
VDLSGQGGQGAAGVRDDGGRGIRHLALGHDEGSAPAKRLGDESRSVALEAGDGDEGEAGPHGAGVVRNTGHTPHAGRDLGAENPGEL